MQLVKPHLPFGGRRLPTWNCFHEKYDPRHFYSVAGFVTFQISEYQKVSGLHPVLAGRTADLQIPESSLKSLLSDQEDRAILAQALRNDLIIPDFQTFRYLDFSTRKRFSSTSKILIYFVRVISSVNYASKAKKNDTL